MSQPMRLGIDVGSKTVKVVILDDEGNAVFETYTRHRSKVRERLAEVVHDFVWRLGDAEVRPVITGSAGIALAETLGIPFVQEVVALKLAVNTLIPDADVILEMGGEDTKLVYLTGTPEQRMNTMCAGGTGGFIDRMAGLMGKRSKDMHSLAMGALATYPIASRCAVFAQSDVRPLLNAGARKEDIAASVLEAVCTQAVAGLSCGRPIEGKVVLLGGPFEHIPALRDAFRRVTGISKTDAVVPKDAHLFVARGAAYSAAEAPPLKMSELEDLIRTADLTDEEGIKRLPPLFEGKDEYERFCERHARVKLPRTDLTSAHENLFIGIDAGSTTMKIAVIDETGALCSYSYDRNRGDVTQALSKMLQRAHALIDGRWLSPHVIRRCCIVGYGEDFCKAAFGIDMGEVETVAHLRAAQELAPDVDFVMDIGGQDIKCFYVRDGVITDIVLNEACSSGCGSLFDSVARSMRKTKEGLAAEALYAKAPVDLGTRCSVFMDSRVKHAQKEGIAQPDIAAGVVYATARNALFKVVKQPDFSQVGSHVMVQGGAFANDALLRAFELETGVEAMRPDKAELMGAWGAALLARDEWLRMVEADPSVAEQRSTLVSAQELDKLTIKRVSVRCSQCANACKLTLTRFLGEGGEDVGRNYVTGNRCEKGALLYGSAPKPARRPPNMVAVKNALIEACDRDGQSDGPLVGIPRALALYESYPFWHAFLTALGCAVLPGTPSSEDVFRAGMTSIPAEGACYSSKLLFGHAADLARRGAEFLFVPAVGLSFAREGLLGLPLALAQRDCPLIERAPRLLVDNAKGSAFENLPVIAPDLVGMPSLEAAVPELARSLAAAGIPCDEGSVAAALETAQAAYRAFFDKLAERSAAVLARIDSGEFPGALVSGHPYHADSGIGHDVDQLLGDLGYAVIEQVDYDFAARPEYEHYPWPTSRDVLHAVEASAAHPNLQNILLRSFGCGIDATVFDHARDMLRADHRIFAELKLDQIVDLAAVRIRLRSLAYAAEKRR